MRILAEQFWQVVDGRARGLPVFPRDRLSCRAGKGAGGKGKRAWFWLLLMACFGGVSPLSAAHPKVQAPQPYATIPVGPLGYRPLGPLYMLLRLSSSSLDFIDDTHLLFTFHQFRLMSREDEPGHDDQTIRGLVLEIPSGKVEASAEWRLHDRRRYLFALGEGSFLLRRGNEIDRMGRDLVLHPFIRFQHNVQTVQISPDGKLLTAQVDMERHSEEKHKQLVQEAISNGDNLPEEDVSIQMVRLDERKVVGDAKSSSLLRMAVTSTGYVSHEQLGNDEWKERFHSFEGKEKVLTETHSTCSPGEDFIRADTLLLNTCSLQVDDRFVEAVNTDGKEVWKGRWDGRFIWPNFSTSSAGRNFATSWIVASHSVDAFFALSDGDVQGQAVQVLSTDTGKLLLSVNASPVASAGQNFALSADGSRLAVLNKGNIELYKVPAEAAP